MPGDLGAPSAAMQRVAAQQERTQVGLQALIDGRFADVHASNDSEREFALMQLGMRLKREWFRSTRAGIYEAREQHSGTQGLAEAVLSIIAQTVSAAAGTYYELSPDQTLRRTANLGCESPAEDAPAKLGEGLVGKCALEGKALLLDKLDQQGLVVRTGLLEITPRAVLLFPIKREDRVCAVLELLFVNDAAPTALELLDYLAHDLAKGPSARPEPVLVDTRVRALEEELVIANARLECVSNDRQQRDRASRSEAQ
jgi:two-component system chemotaxis sensor kinase CheA